MRLSVGAFLTLSPFTLRRTRLIGLGRQVDAGVPDGILLLVAIGTSRPTWQQLPYTTPRWASMSLSKPIRDDVRKGFRMAVNGIACRVYPYTHRGRAGVFFQSNEELKGKG